MNSLWHPIKMVSRRFHACFRLALVCTLAPVASAAPIPATAQAIRIPAENLAAILPGGLGMETIDPAVMRRIEKAVQLEKAFVEGKWEGSLSMTEVTRIEANEEPVIEANGLWHSMGMNGEIEILESSPNGLYHSCRIYLGLNRKGTLADAKAPNFGNRLAKRARRVSGIFQLTDGSHTLLAALPQTLTDGDDHTLLFIVSLGKPGAAPPANPPRNGLVTIETYRMAMDDWHRIPQAVRDDYPQLLEKCRSSAGKGKIDRIDRISTCATSKGKVKMDCTSAVKMCYPTDFGIRDQQMNSEHWENRNVGSTLSGTREAGANPLPISIHYEKIPQLPVWSPTLKDGAAKDIAISKFPVFGAIRYDGSTLGGDSPRTCLLGIAPLPLGGEAPQHVALMFASVANQGSPTLSATDPEIMVEVLVARGPSGANTGDAGSRIKSLLARPGSIETIAAATVVSGRTVMSSGMRWIYPMETLAGGDSIVIPSQFASLHQGTELEVINYGYIKGDKIAIYLHLEHALRKPLLPMATNHGNSFLNPEKPVTYDLKLHEKPSLSPGVWAYIKEMPLEPILGVDDPSAKGQSCHVFVRLIRSSP